MFCKNCGHQHDDRAAVCLNCGVMIGVGESFCPNCGMGTMPNAHICTNCGIALTQPVIAGEQKSKLAAGLLGIFLGYLGVHNFYLGYTGKAIAQLLLTLLTFGIGATISSVWGLIEGILILTGSIDKDANNIPLKD
ncbi:MAG: TM2 domain-containing protein [Clostridia bacterium]|nr:TM2 domain-containing protein [Clostridia bacterium]